MEVVLWKTKSIERKDKLGNRLQVIYIYIQKNLLDCLAIQKSRSLISWPLKWLYSSVGVIIFCSVRFLLKKNNQTNFFKKTKTEPNRNQFKPSGFGSVFLDKNRFKLVWFGFYGLAWFFFGLGSIRFFRFQNYKTEPVGFLKILICFFSRFGFFSYLFSGFFGLISFSVFLLPSIP